MIVVNREEFFSIWNQVHSTGLITSAGAKDEVVLHGLKMSVELPSNIVNGLGAMREGTLPYLIIRLDCQNIFNEPLSTPTSYPELKDGYELNFLQVYALRVAQALGQPFGVPFERNGAVVANIIPVKSLANREHLTGAFRRDLQLHTEDASLSVPADYLCLACHRNNEEAPTILSLLEDVRLPESTWKTLNECEYEFTPNVKNENQSDQLFPVVDKLTGRLRLDLFRRANSEISTFALTELTRQMSLNAFPVNLVPGDILIINNRKVAHGRRSFNANTSGGGRWLSRVRVLKHENSRVCGGG